MAPFEELYHAHFKQVYAYALLRVRDAALAEDLCASVWRKAYEKLAGYDQEKGVFAQWLFGIARNEINMHWRRARLKNFFSLTSGEELLPAREPSPLRQAEDEELKARLLGAVKKLSAKERDLISLKFYSGLNNRQIAAVCGLGESNVGTLLHRAVQKMRKDMEDA